MCLFFYRKHQSRFQCWVGSCREGVYFVINSYLFIHITPRIFWWAMRKRAPAIKAKLISSLSSFALKYISACTHAKAFPLTTCSLLITECGEETKADPLPRNTGFHGQLILAQKIFDIFSRYSLDLHDTDFLFLPSSLALGSAGSPRCPWVFS